MAGSKGRGASCSYYLECILEYIAKHDGHFSSLIDLVDIHGDTALNVAARIGAKRLVDQLLDVGASSEIENLAGLNATSFGFGKLNNSPTLTMEPETLVKDEASLGTRIVFPSIATTQEQEDTTSSHLSQPGMFFYIKQMNYKYI
jgi:regulatory protein SWI6